jgi:hypothetical protein
MSDLTTPMGNAAEPAPDAPGNGDGWSTGKKVLAGAAIVAIVLAACAGALLAASGSDDDSSSVSSDASTTSSTGATTTTTLSAGAFPATTAKSGAAPGTSATTTTKPAKQAAPTPTAPLQPGITMPDEPSFTSLVVPSTYHCTSPEFAKVTVSWATQNATSLSIQTDYPESFNGISPQPSSAKINVKCSGPTSMTVRFSLSGPGGSAVATRTMSITH